MLFKGRLHAGEEFGHRKITGALHAALTELPHTRPALNPGDLHRLSGERLPRLNERLHLLRRRHLREVLFGAPVVGRLLVPFLLVQLREAFQAAIKRLGVVFLDLLFRWFHSTSCDVLDLNNVPVGVSNERKRHTGRVLTALDNRTSSVLDISNCVVQVDRVIDVKADVLRPVPCRVSVSEKAHGDIRPRKSHEDDVLVSKHLLQIKGLRVEAGRLVYISDGQDEDKGGDLRHQNLPNARRTRSGVNGASVRRAPTASNTALPTAAAPATIEGSPTMRAPYGPSSDGTSTTIASMGGRALVVGSR